MEKAKVLTVINIRPDILRLAFTIKRLDAEPNIQHILVHTGQHYDANLSEVFFQEMGVRQPDYNLGVGAPGKEHYQQHADLIPKLVELCREVKPDLICFLGDANGVLAAVDLKKDGFKICHIEAGMRSFDESMPEEINRIAIDHVSDLLLVYHKNYAMKAMLENIDRKKIKVVGNTIVEPAFEMKKQLRFPSKKSHILVDIHRQENHSSKDRLEKILDFVDHLGVVYEKPVKMLAFGRTKAAVDGWGLKVPEGCEWTPLMGYKDFCQAQVDSWCVVSDSGTQIEEGPIFEVPVLVPRSHSERPEGYDFRCGAQVDLRNLTGLSIDHAIDFIASYKEEGCETDWLGDGKTSEHIVEEIKKFLRIK